MQYKSNQQLSPDVKQQIITVEQTDPTLFEELSLKRKWSNVAKDPIKGLKDGHINKNSYWQILNHLPSKGVQRIVTDKILKYDKISCDSILKGILEEKQLDDYRKNLIQKNRLDLRAKLNSRHNKIVDLEKRSGVRLGMNHPDQVQ